MAKGKFEAVRKPHVKRWDDWGTWIMAKKTDGLTAGD